MSKYIDIIRDSIKRNNKTQLWIIENCQYLTMMGSRAYDTYTKDSDYDFYGFTVPPKDYVFPFQNGYLYGFDKDVPKFGQYNPGTLKANDQEIDFSIYSIIKYVRLVMENNPNMLDSLFTKSECVIKSTKIGEILRVNRRKFLHKGSYHKFKGYAYSQMKKAKSKNREGKRKHIIEKYGFDTKYAGHIVRLLDEAEQILQEGDIDITRASEEVKAVNRGDVPLEEIEDKFNRKERYLNKLYEESDLRYSPDVDFVKSLLLRCLEEHFGSIDEVERSRMDSSQSLVDDILEVIERYR